MQIIAVDDEHLALKNVERVVRNALPECELSCFDTPSVALGYAKNNPIDIAFLDIEMGGMNGLELAKRLKEINGHTSVIFITGYSDYAVEAYSVPACGFIVKPVSAKAVLGAMEHLRKPVEKVAPRLRVQCFGNFEVFKNGVPLYFPRKKAKELFAYLVHKRGTTCTTQELIAVLFEDKSGKASLQKQIQTHISVMMKVLREAGVDDVVLKGFNSIAIDPGKIDCDYYNFIKWDPEAVNQYMGEYITNYAWAEFMIGYLDSKIFK